MSYRLQVLEHYIKSVVSSLEDEFNSHADQWHPVLLVGNDVEGLLIFGIATTNSDGEVEPASSVRSVTPMLCDTIQTHLAEEVGLVFPGWWAETETADPHDTREALLVCIMDRNVMQGWIAEIDRPPGKPPALRDWTPQNVYSLDFVRALQEAIRG